ncbi:hypothetical protein [Ectopseudomonas khazarica]|uniref:hypothetical protein n=1 Tax=Ectopseudomonas khazarica TaxID=2502979 RepID=UPI003B961D29
MSGYVPNNRNERPAPAPEPYNGDFDRQPARQLEGAAAQANRCLVGLRFVWDNGECIGANLPYSLTPSSGGAVRGSLDARGGLVQSLPAGEYEAQLLADSDVDSDISSARAELQAVLDEILAAERAEAARLQAIQDQRSAVSNYLHRRLAAGKGFFLGAWGLLKTVKEYSDLVNPFTIFSNTLRSAWQARASEGESWLAAYNRQFSAEQHRELVEALGFDPSSITREQLAEAYELACFIYEDDPSKAMLGRFAVDYAQAQNAEEVAEFSGGVLFEIVLSALLIVFTAGVGLAARGAASVSYVDKLTRLGNALKRLSAALKRARIRRGGKTRGTGTGARTVEVERPKAVEPSRIPPVPPPYKLESFRAPATGKNIVAAVNGNAIVPLDKVNIYARGKVPDVTAELRDLNKLKQSNRKLFDSSPENEKRLEKLNAQKHNLERSKDMSRRLEDIGFPDTPENNEALIKHLLDVGNEVTPERHTWVTSTLTGPKGTLKVESTWKILDDHRAYLTTLKLIPISP